MTHASLVRFFLLGSLRVECAGTPVRFSTRKIESLLAYLVLHPHAHAREKLAALLWGDSPDAQARQSLRQALAAIRKELGDAFVLADRETAQINPTTPVWVDAREFEQLASADPLAALELYRDDLLPDFYDEWIAPVREHLRRLYRDTALHAIHDARAQGAYPRAIDLAQKLLTREPAHETAHQHLIFCYTATGNRAAAREQFAQCERVLRDELNVAPASETIALYRRAQTVATDAPTSALFTNLPITLDSFVGRVKEIQELHEILSRTRLLTLTGAGGCGKTRLAIQVATEFAAAERFPHGVWWVDLSALRDPALVTQTVAAIFDVRESRETTLIAALTHFLRGKNLLLVLDNCEHLLDACAQLSGVVLSACPQVQILATSRELLGVSGEVVWRVPSLAVPNLAPLPPLEQLRQFDAIQLFVERARAVAAPWRLAENALPVARICARLDGIPLAIELAAARLRALSAHEIATRLDARFDLLTGGNRPALPRQQTLRATMDWSYDLLSDAERVLLQKLSVFAGGFSLEAVETVDSGQWTVDSNLNTDHRPLPTILDLLTTLADKSLVVVEHQDARTRYRLLETVRQYAREKFADADARTQTQVLHCNYFVEWIEHAAPHLRRADALEWRDRIEREHDNLRAAFEFVIERDAARALRIAWGLHLFWMRYGFLSEGRAWLERLLPQIDAHAPLALRARARNLAGYLAYLQMDIPHAIRMSEQALTFAQAAEEEWEIAFAFQRLGWTYGFVRTPNKPRSVEDCHMQSLEIFQRLGDEDMITESMFGLGHTLSTGKDFERGVALLKTAIERQRAAGNRESQAAALGWLSLSYTLANDLTSAEPYAQDALALARTLRSKNSLGIALIFLGRCVLRKDEPRRALPYAVEAVQLYHEKGDVSTTVMILEELALCVGLLGKADAAARILGAIQFQWETKRASPLLRIGIYDRQWGAIRAQIGDAAFDQARAEGRVLSLDETVELALTAASKLEIGN